MTKWFLTDERFSRAGKRIVREVHVRSKVPRSFYRQRITLYKKGMIKYQYSKSGTKLDFDGPWMKAPAKYRKTHRKSTLKRRR